MINVSKFFTGGVVCPIVNFYLKQSDCVTDLATDSTVSFNPQTNQIMSTTNILDGKISNLCIVASSYVHTL